MSTLLTGIDIGGTKCAVCLGEVQAAGVTLLEKQCFSTPPTPAATLSALGDALERILHGRRLAATGISCGGPLDSARGLILSPPNLPGWEHIDVVAPFRERFNAPAMLQNDANACALAEWQWGAGRGCRSMIFLTFGTGMGAGLILDGRLYTGASDMAGEVGHIRLAETGPLGYDKRGSFEGFCSGGGIARWAQQRALTALQEGYPPTFCPTLEALPTITAEGVGKAAQAGDPLARSIFDAVAQRLGQGLALLVDILNPERIIIGSIYGRQRELLETTVGQILRAEAHPHALDACDIIPAGLGEQVGDHAGLAVAALALESAVTEER